MSGVVIAQASSRAELDQILSKDFFIQTRLAMILTKLFLI